jgi:CHAT domain-containing protein/Tfp pilus assembly protein PilF
VIVAATLAVAAIVLWRKPHAAVIESAVPQARDSALVELARQQPDSLRGALTRSLALAAAGLTVPAQSAQIDSARHQAAAWERAWADSFWLRNVERFERWSPRERALRAAADSLRLAGNIEYGQKGVPAAMRLWRESLRLAALLNDSVGRAASLGSVGVGFYRAGLLDSASWYFSESRALAQLTGDRRTLGNAVGNLANISKDRGALSDASRLYRESLAIRELSGDSRGAAIDQNNLGLIQRELGNLDGARASFLAALVVNRSSARNARSAAVNLENLGDLASMTGDYADSDSLYRQALGINEAAGDHALIGFVLHKLGLLAIRRGEYRQAQRLLEQALAIHQESGERLDIVSNLRELAEVRAATGEIQPALDLLRRAEADATAGATTDTALLAGLALSRAELDVELGAYPEADAEYRRAEQLYRTRDDEAGKSEAEKGRGLLLYLRGDRDGALRLLDLAARGQSLTGDPRAAALTQLLVGDVQRDMQDTTAALHTLTEARTRLHHLGDVVGEAAALNGLGSLAIDRGLGLAAEVAYRSGIELLGERPVTDVLWQLHAGLGEALRRRGALGAAVAELRAAIQVIEHVARDLPEERDRAGFLGDKWSVYGALAFAEQTRGRPAEAFAASEQLRARQMADMLARGRITTTHVTGAQEQDLRRRITELTRELESDPPARQQRREPVLASPHADALREALDAAQQAYATLLTQIRAGDPAWARLVTAETVSWEEVARRLDSDEVLLEYLVGDSSSSVFVVTQDTVATIDLDVGRRTLANLIDFARRTIDRPEHTGSAYLWRSPLRRLDQYLVEPVERAGLLEGKRKLVIVPHAELHFLSFAMLIVPDSNDRFLVERYQLSYAPSATLWVQFGERPVKPNGGGVLALAPDASNLPASREEVAAIRRAYGHRARVLLGAAATEGSLQALANRWGVIHLATHGILNRSNPLFSFVELAPGNVDDGRLEVHEVYGLDLSGRLVVLSACETGLGSGASADVPPGDDWVGFVQAFLYAGARNVMASLWPVDDRATAQLMEQFYRRLAVGSAEADALAAAQRAVMRDPAFAHPFYWAGFVLNGGAGRD